MNRPARPPLHGAAIPAELTTQPRWLGWRYQWRDSKWTKPPVAVMTGGLGKSTEAATWCAFAEALAGMDRRHLDGIGFVLGDGWAGVDFDECRDPATGALSDFAREWIGRLNNYAEVSPSGTGVKVFCRGELPPGSRRRDTAPRIEMYDTGRYFTVTGAHLDGTPTSINDATPVLADLHAAVFGAPSPKVQQNGHHAPAILTDIQVIDLCRKAKNGATFERLWAGDTGGHDGDDSRADLALVSLLAFYTQDEAQLDRLFRQSGLMRDKWQRGNYRASTLAKALNRTETWEGEVNPPTLDLKAKKAPAVVPAPSGKSLGPGITARQLQHKHFKPLKWIVDEMVPEGALLIAGKPKSKKSWLALGIALAVAMNGRALGRLSVTPGRVLYLDLEGNQQRIQRRLRTILGARTQEWPDNLHIFTAGEWPSGHEAMPALVQWFDDYPDTVLVIVDVLQDFRPPIGPKENPYDYDRNTLKVINQLAEARHATIILIHHTRKAKSDDAIDEISGTLGAPSAVATYWVLSRALDGKHTILTPNGRDLTKDEPVALLWDPLACLHMLDGTADEANRSQERQIVLDALVDDEAHTPREIALAIGKSVNAVQLLLGELLHAGQIDKVGHGRYARVPIRSQGQNGQN